MTHKILAIDDHPQTLEIVIITLQQHGFLAVGTDSPTEAVTMAEKERPDLILLDMNMPEINGLEVCRRLRIHPQLGKVPIIMFSAEATEKLAGFETGPTSAFAPPLPEGGDPSRPPSGADPHHLPPPESDMPDRRPAEVIAVVGARGGSGTTTLATNLALTAAELGRATTLVDLDLLQGHVGLFLKSKASGGLNHLAQLPDDELAPQIPRLLVRYNESLQLLLTNSNLYGRYPTPSPGQMSIIINQLKQERDLLIFDLGCGISRVARAVLEELDQVIVCVRPERVSLAAARVLLKQLKEASRPGTLVRALMVDSIGGMKLPKPAIERFLNHRVLATIPAQPKGMTQAINKGAAYVQLYPESKVTKLFQLLVKHLVPN
jgi:MinD-like ATPase involved in chromosome partitioning or flagellar assembly